MVDVELTLVGKPGCHLCDDARSIIQGLLEDRAARGQALAALRERDITSDPATERELFDKIPVAELKGRRLDVAISPAKLRRFLAEGLDAIA